jgi:hypothetical protein
VLGSLSSILVLIGVAFFLALGLAPVASWLVNRKLPRWAATTLVFVIFLAVMAAFVAAAIPPLAQQANELVQQAPHYVDQLRDHSSVIGRLNDRFRKPVDVGHDRGWPAPVMTSRQASGIRRPSVVPPDTTHTPRSEQPPGFIAVWTARFIPGHALERRYAEAFAPPGYWPPTPEQAAHL